jgi:Cdc6-like AAA superfamily ATPase
MTIAVVKNQINAFLATEKPEVIAIKGAWGIGKTYSWKQFLLAAKQSKEIALKRYSYVSLFGINSLEALKYAIFENVISRDIIGTEANIETFKSNTTTLLESMGRKSLGIFRGASLLKGFTPAIESLFFV